MKTVLMSPPEEGGRTFIEIHGRVYESAPGGAVPVPDFDAPVLEANGWTRFAAPIAPASAATYAAGAVSGVVSAPGGSVAGLGVRLYLDGAGAPVGFATADASGAWSIATGVLAPGPHSFSVEIDETAGVFVAPGASAGGAMDFSDLANSGLVAALAA